MPMLIIATALIAVIGNAKLWWLVLAMSMLYPIQMIRIGLRSGSLAYGFFVVLGKFPQMLGQMKYLPRWFQYYGGLADKIEGSVTPIDKKGMFHY